MRQFPNVHRNQAIVLLLLVLSFMSSSFHSPALAQIEGETKIVFVTQDMNTDAMTLNIANFDGANVVPLVTDGFFFQPVLSPDGTHIVFDGEHPASGRRNLFMIDTDGTNLHLLVEGRTSYRPSGPIAWSPDSTQLIFGFLDYNRRPGGFYRMNTDGSDLEQIEIDDLPNTLGTNDFRDTWVAWSPDGERIAFKVATDTVNDNGAFYLANPDGTGATPFPAMTDDGAARDRLMWSPDGTQLALYTLASMFNDGAIYIANADGSNLETLVTLPGYPSSVAWCSDDRQIVFVANEAGVESMPGGDVWAIHPDGSNLQSLNITDNVANVGTSCGVVPEDVIPPSAPISFADVTR